MSKIFLLFIFTFLYYAQSADGKKGFGQGEQDWGYVKVRTSAHMFWWLYYVNPSTGNKTDVFSKPLIIWLQGGPGASSTGFGNFEELGPLDIKLKPRKESWVNDYNILFIDNPVGSGFSYVESYQGYAKTNEQIALDLVECMKGFYLAIPQFRNVSTYITAESYGGKMAIDFALMWYYAQKNGEIESNLKGVGLGDSWISPIDSVLSWGPFLLSTGMVDTAGYNEIQKAALQTKKAVDMKKWSEATDLWAMTENVIIKVTENIDFYNILTKTNPSGSIKEFSSFNEAELEILMNEKVKVELKLNKTWSFHSPMVFRILAGDFMKPATESVEKVLNETNLKVFTFTGQLDLIVATPGTLNWVENLKWFGSKLWKNAPRRSLSIDGVIEGYVKSYKNFKMYWINRSGHMVPLDNPSATKKMLQDLTQ